MLTQPAVSATHLAFIYGGDLFVADLGAEVSNVRRLTTDDGIESNPAFSPDGKTIAFSAQYDGNVDVYTVPLAGGSPARLTWHPGADTVQGFTPDGRSVLFTSQRATFTTRYAQLFTVPVQGGIEEALPIPNASRATYSPDGLRIAYNPLAARFLQWKQYRGGTASRLWLYSVKGHAVEKIPQPAGRANDTDPMWMGDTVYFRSDRAGEFNLFAFDTKSKQVQQLTRHADFPVLTASSGGGRIVYEQAGSLHLFDPRGGAAKRLTIGVASDLRETRPRFAKGAKWIRDAALSPTGARAAFNFRGEIVTVPAEKGDVRNLTNSTAVHDRFPAWSPDGRSLAWFSDANDAYRLYVGSQDGKGEPRAITVKGEGFYSDPVWSPDSQKIAYYDNSQSVYWVDVKSGVSKKVASQPLYGPVVVLSYSWSPDSKWLAYAMDNRAYITTVYAYSIEQDKSFQISDGLSDVSNPAFDKSGKYLFFLASTDAGPVKDWFAQSNADMRVTSGIYLAVLPNDLVSPLARESDEEKPAAGEKKEEAKPDGRKEDAKGPVPEDKPAAREQPFRIDFDGLPYRILDLPIAPAEISNLQAGTAGQVYYLKTVDGKSALNRYDLTARKNETLLPDVSGYVVSADGKKLLYASDNKWSIVSTTKKIEPAEGRLNVEGIEVRVDPRGEWQQIFDEAWRINRDYFYAPNMHGVDWEQQHEKYAAFLPHVATRADLNRVLQWMSSELSVGHHNVGGGDALVEPKSDSRRPARRRLRDCQRPVSSQEGLRRPQLEPAAARAAHRARRQRQDRRVSAGGERQGAASSGQRLQPVREHVRQDRRDHARPECRRHGIADRAGRAGRQRSRAAQPRLGRRQPAEGEQGDRRSRGLRLRAQHRRLRPLLLQALLLPAGLQGRRDRRRALQRRRQRCRLLHRHPAASVHRQLGDALRRRPQDAVRLDPGSEGDDHRRDRRVWRRPAAVDVPQIQDGSARRAADLGWPGWHPRLPGAHGRRHDHGAEPRHLDA